MPRETYVIRDGQLVPKHLAAPLHAAQRGPSIISDTLDGLLNPIDGKRYDSRKAYDAVARRAGLECIGNEDLAKHVGRRPESSSREIADSIKRAMWQHGVRL
jgi:hypothetical protein